MTAVLESEAACPEPASPLETLAGIGLMGDPMRVLFVEDDRYHRELLLTELSKRGFAGWGFSDSASLLGARVMVDGRVVGEFPAFSSTGVERISCADIKVELAHTARRLRIEPLRGDGGRETFARIRRVIIVRPAERPAASAR